MTQQPDRPGQARFCPQCGHRNRRTAKVCAQCGHRFTAHIADKKWCSECGTPNHRRAKVCTHCGHRFRRQQQEGAVLPQIAEAPIVQTPDAPLILPEEFSQTPQLDSADGQVGQSRPANLDGEPAPTISGDALDILREDSLDNLDAYERLKRSLQGKRL